MIYRTDRFIKEFARFPEGTKEDLLSLIHRYLKGERLPKTMFKTFSLDKKIRIQEFKVKDHRGNWRVISCLVNKGGITLVYAFHKKTQVLSEKDKSVIKKRVAEVQDG